MTNMTKTKALKIAGIVSAVLAAVWAATVWLPRLALFSRFGIRPDASSIGIIGGADGPTSVFVTYIGAGAKVMFWIITAMPLVLAAVSAACFRIRKKRLNKGE